MKRLLALLLLLSLTGCTPSPEEEQSIEDTSQALRDLTDGSGTGTTDK